MLKRIYKKALKRVLVYCPDDFFRRKAARRVDTIWGFTEKPAILIHQMGKVGSTSVYRALQHTEVKERMLRLHYISDRVLDAQKQHQYCGVKPIPWHLFIGEALNRKLNAISDHPLKIVTLVRDPIATLVSSIFQNPNFYNIGRIDHSDKKVIISKIENIINKVDFYEYIFSWFDIEIKDIFGIDVYSVDFNKENGWGETSNANVELIILQLEKLNKLDISILERFIGCKIFSLTNENTRKNISNKFTYKDIINDLIIDKKTIDYVFNSNNVTSFYSDEDIQSMKQKWIR